MARVVSDQGINMSFLMAEARIRPLHRNAQRSRNAARRTGKLEPTPGLEPGTCSLRDPEDPEE